MTFERDDHIPFFDEPVVQPKRFLTDVSLRDISRLTPSSLYSPSGKYFDYRFQSDRLVVSYAGQQSEKIWEACRNRSVHDNISRHAIFIASQFHNIPREAYFAEMALRGSLYVTPQNTESLEESFLLILADEPGIFEKNFANIALKEKTAVVYVGEETRLLFPLGRKMGVFRPLWRDTLALIELSSNCLRGYGNEHLKGNPSPESLRVGESHHGLCHFDKLAAMLNEAEAFYSFTGKGEDACIQCLKQLSAAVPEISPVNSLAVSVSSSPKDINAFQDAFAAAYSLSGSPEYVLKNYIQYPCQAPKKQELEFFEMHILFSGKKD
jgi:hypothetical protein